MNNEQHNSSDKRKLKERLKTITIIVLIIIIIILLLRSCGCVKYSGTQNNQGNNNVTQIIEDDDIVLQDTSKGTIRIKMNPIINVNKGMMEDLNFCNYNENRMLKIKIIVNGECLYESVYVKEGEILKGDLINTSFIEKGEHEAIAEVYSFNDKEELISQTNIAFKLNYIS